MSHANVFAAIAFAALVAIAPSPSLAGAGSKTVPALLNPVPLVTPSPMPFHDLPVRTIASPEPPQHLRAALTPYDCNGHAAPFECTAVIEADRLVLLWDHPASGVAGGYRVYGVDAAGNGANLIATVTNDSQTIAELPASASGYAGRCYAVSTYFATRESARGAVFCATAASAAKTAFLVPVEQRASYEYDRKNLFAAPVPAGLIVGYQYADSKHSGWDGLEDGYSNMLHRSAVEFDVSPYVRHRLLVARLHLTIGSSTSAEGNNHSCATTVGTGTEFWWKSDANSWTQVAPAPAYAMPSTGPQVTSEVTGIVAPWLTGAPNYGLVVRNTDENLKAFTNGTCLTTYVEPMLEIVYF